MEFCTEPNILQVFYILKLALNIIFIVVPIIFMVMIFKDIFMAVVNSKPDDELKSVLSKSIKRFIAAIIVFFLPSIFSFVFTDLVTVDASLLVCFENASLDKINEYKTMSEEERKADAAKRKEELNKAAKERNELEDKKNEQIKKEREEKEKQEAAENQANGSSTVTGNSNNEYLALKTYSGSKTVNYWELVPPNISKKPALVVFLHGSGECGNPSGMLRTGLPKFMNNGSLNSYDAIFIAPNTSNCSWSSDATSTKELIDYVVNEYNVDRNHIIITGHSLGGNGTWDMVSRYPGFFSVAVPVSGCPNAGVEKYLDIPIRSYVGASESSYYKNCNTNYAPKINNSGGNIQYILVPSPNDTHGAVINVYGDSELINWMLNQ